MIRATSCRRDQQMIVANLLDLLKSYLTAIMASAKRKSDSGMSHHEKAAAKRILDQTERRTSVALISRPRFLCFDSCFELPNFMSHVDCLSVNRDMSLLTFWSKLPFYFVHMWMSRSVLNWTFSIVLWWSPSGDFCLTSDSIEKKKSWSIVFDRQTNGALKMSCR